MVTAWEKATLAVGGSHTHTAIPQMLKAPSCMLGNGKVELDIVAHSYSKAPRKLVQEDSVFQASPGYLARPCLKTKKEGIKGYGQDDTCLHISIKRLKKTDMKTV